MKKLTFLLLVMSSTILLAQNRETRTVDNFTKLSFGVPGKLYLKQGSPQKVEIEGDKDILKDIKIEVTGNRLKITKEDKWFDWDSDDDAVKVYVTMPNIEGISVSGSGSIIGQGKITTTNIDLNIGGSGSMTLDIDASGDIEAGVAGSGDLKVTGRCKNVDSDVAGSGNVDLNVTITNEASFDIAGSGEIKASGSAESIKTSISGSGKLSASNLEAKRANVSIAGSGDVEINVKDEINSNIAGSGNVYYKGNPGKVNNRSAGSGEVKRM